MPNARGVATGLVIDGAAVQAMQADLLQSVNANGANIKVGVISGDDSGNAASQAAGYLPATIWADPSYPGSTPTPGDPAEGTAMLEEVHAMAPGASLGFCGPPTTADFVTCYQDFVTWGANVIVDDLGWRGNDMFTIGAPADGSFAAAITQITQANPQVAFASSAGNDARDYFQAHYIAGPACTINGTTYPSCMDFGQALGQSSANELP
ncbi:protease, partial [mine drainage metagenome]